MDVALKTKAIPISASSTVTERSGLSMSPEFRKCGMSAARHHAHALRRRGMEEGLHDLLRDGGGGRASVARILDHHRDRDAGLLRRGVADEEGVVVPVRVLRRAGLSRDPA